MRRWIGFEMASSRQTRIRFERNLVLETQPEPMEAAIIDEIAGWFTDNWWESDRSDGEGLVDKLAKQTGRPRGRSLTIDGSSRAITRGVEAPWICHPRS